MKLKFIEGSAPGAIPNGTQIRKRIHEEKDAHEVGARGIVRSSLGPVPFKGKDEFGYFVEWEDLPGVPVFVVGCKIEEISH